MNLADAQKKAKDDPKLKAAVAVSLRKAEPSAGITDDPAVEVELYTLVKEASSAFKARKESLEMEGFSVTYGTVGRGLVIMERGDDAVSMSLVRRTTPRSGDRR